MIRSAVSATSARKITHASERGEKKGRAEARRAQRTREREAEAEDLSQRRKDAKNETG